MKSLFLLNCLLLSSCTVYNEQFECEPVAGVGCKSLTQINQMVDEGILPFNGKEDKAADLKKHPHLHIWVAPYKDEKGVSHQPAYHTVPFFSSGS